MPLTMYMYVKQCLRWYRETGGEWGKRRRKAYLCDTRKSYNRVLQDCLRDTHTLSFVVIDRASHAYICLECFSCMGILVRIQRFLFEKKLVITTEKRLLAEVFQEKSMGESFPGKNPWAEVFGPQNFYYEYFCWYTGRNGSMCYFLVNSSYIP